MQGPTPPPPKFGSGPPGSTPAIAPASAAAARVAASLALLTGAGRSTHADFDDDEDEGSGAGVPSQQQRAEGGSEQAQGFKVPAAKGAAGKGPSADWAPPTNQTGDGRTQLNDKYGY
jgi:hypothetical protein